MLDNIVTNLIAQYNVKKITDKGKIYDVFREEGPALYTTLDAEGKTFEGYLLQFLFDDRGLIRYAGHSRNFPKPAMKKFNSGSFSVAVDIEYLAKAAKMGMNSYPHKEERIIKSYCDYSKLDQDKKEKVQRRLQASMDRFNYLYGFDPDYGGFTPGNSY